jgi:pSer/pThr/pTyr-binding forkhead associated (FHA) protein
MSESINYGKLILSLPEGVEQEFTISRTGITLGRATTSDIVISDARVSRSHARIEFGPQSCTLIDLGSSNGTRLNGTRVEKTPLAHGDTISLGSSSLRYMSAEIEPEAGLEMTLIDSEADLATSLAKLNLPMALNETRSPRLVIHSPARTWELSLEDLEEVSIGRSTSSKVQIDHPKVSRRHAQIIRRGDTFIVRDLGSANGTQVGGRQVEEQALENGDTIEIGGTRIVYKTPVTEASLTMVGGGALPSIRHPVVFVPGFMGSELWRGSERVWPQVKYLFTDPDLFLYSENTPLEARGLLQEVVIVPNLIKLEQYGRLGDYLVEELGYEREKDYFEFFYDWRQDIRRSARSLAQMVASLPVKGPIVLIAHSMGTLVSRYFVECLGGKDRVSRLLLIGGPHLGTPTAVTSLAMSANLLPFGLMGDRLRHLISSFPSIYQILPTYACAIDQNGDHINMLENELWLDEAQRPLLRDARRFRQELGTASSVPAVSIFGYGSKTIAGLSLLRDAKGSWTKLSFNSSAEGDDTIPTKSGILKNSEIHPVQQHHGTLYVDNDVKMRLKLELMRAG